MFGNLAAFGECIFFAVPDSLGLFDEPFGFLFLSVSLFLNTLFDPHLPTLLGPATTI